MLKPSINLLKNYAKPRKLRTSEIEVRVGHVLMTSILAGFTFKPSSLAITPRNSASFVIK